MKYMLIDVTAVETTAVLAIATNPRGVFQGRRTAAGGAQLFEAGEAATPIPLLERLQGDSSR